MIKTVWRIVFVLLLLAGAVKAAPQDNLCFTTKAGACQSDIEWEIGYFWGHNEVSLDSCSAYFRAFGASVGDIWGMCASYLPDPQGAEAATETDDDANAELVFLLTSRDHPWQGEGSNACPVEGLDPIINYEENTFVCGTSF